MTEDELNVVYDELDKKHGKIKDYTLATIYAKYRQMRLKKAE
jgi:hypothetical protein